MPNEPLIAHRTRHRLIVLPRLASYRRSWLSNARWTFTSMTGASVAPGDLWQSAPLITTQAELTPANETSHWVALAVGLLVGFAIGWWVARSRLGRHASVIAREVEQIGTGASEERFAQLQDTLGEPWSDIASAGRRATRSIAAQAQTIAARARDLEAILFSTASGFIAIDASHHVLDLNPAACEWLRVSRTEAQGRLIQEVTRQPALNRFLNETVDRAEPIEQTLRLEGPTPRDLRATSEPLRDAAGRTVGVLISLQDVTRVTRLETLRSDFVANVSHELRTPITSIKGYVETLLQVGTDDPAQAKKFLEIIHRNAVRLSSLVEDLLALASLEQAETVDAPPLEMQDCAAADIVMSVLELLEPAAEARRITLRHHLDRNIRIRVNRTLIEQAISNLLSNAIRYSPEGATITLGVRRIDGLCELSVIDTGPGIAPKHLERIFERFYRVDRSRSSAAGGTGLGLAIVKHIAQAHGGRVDVESEIGRGSRFFIRLPESESIPGI